MFLRRGLNVALADVDEAGLVAVRGALGAGPDRLMLHACDVTQSEALRAAALEAQERLGDFDVVCLNAGIVGAVGAAEGLGEAAWRRVFDVNLLGPVNGAGVFMPLLRAQETGGRLVFTASVAGMQGVPEIAPYAASKAAVVSLAETLWQETKGSKIGVSVLCPGYARTALTASVSAGGGSSAAQEAMLRAIQTGLPPEAVAQALERGIDAGDLYIFTHEDTAPWLRRKIARIEEALGKVAPL